VEDDVSQCLQVKRHDTFPYGMFQSVHKSVCVFEKSPENRIQQPEKYNRPSFPAQDIANMGNRLGMQVKSGAINIMQSTSVTFCTTRQPTHGVGCVSTPLHRSFPSTPIFYRPETMAEPINEDAIVAMRLVANTIQDIAEVSTIQLANKQLLRGLLKSVLDGYDELQKQENKKQEDKKQEDKKQRASLVKQRTAIACLEEAIIVSTEYLEFLEAHNRKFRQGLKKSWEPLALQQYVLDDAKVYTKAVTEFNSRSQMALGPLVATHSEEAAIDHNKDKMSVLAARIAARGADMATASKTTDSV
jgi:hypothetical protein